MSFLSRWFSRRTKDISGGTSNIAVLGTGRHATTITNAQAYAKEGYGICSVVFRCVNIISKNLAGAPLQVWDGDKEVAPTHPLVVLLKRPNPLQSGAAFFEIVCAWHRITGNVFIEALGPRDEATDKHPPVELWCWAPLDMKVIAGPNRLPEAYLWENGSDRRVWPVNYVTGESALMHWHTFNPLNELVGMSPMAAAAYDIDQHTTAGRWNYNLLKNNAVPPGTLEFPTNLTEDQRRSVLAQFEEKYAGASNARRAMLLEGGLKWQAVGLSAQELDWLEGRKDAGRCVASVYGVPDQLIPIPGSQTFANYREARLALWEDTILPLLDELLEELNRWLSPRYGPHVRITYDQDQISALEPRRQERWTAIQNANWLTINEKRAATNYEVYQRGTTAADQIWMQAGLLPIDDIVPQDDGAPE